MKAILEQNVHKITGHKTIEATLLYRV